MAALGLSKAMKGPDFFTQSQTGSSESEISTAEISHPNHQKRPSGLAFRSQEPSHSSLLQPSRDRILDQKHDPEILQRPRQENKPLARRRPRSGEHTKHSRSREENRYYNLNRVGTREHKAYLQGLRRLELRRLELKRLEENKLRWTKMAQERRGPEMGDKLSYAQPMQQHQASLRKRRVFGRPLTPQEVAETKARKILTGIGENTKEPEGSLGRKEEPDRIEGEFIGTWNDFTKFVSLGKEAQQTPKRHAATTLDNKLEPRQGLNTEFWDEAVSTIPITHKLDASGWTSDKVNRSSTELQMLRMLEMNGLSVSKARRSPSSSLPVKRTISEDCTGAHGNERPSKLQCLKKEARRHEQPHIDHLTRAESSRPTKGHLRRTELSLAALRA
ncbi:hypothetical protein BJX65DRAFT_199637 [Aspergillus insuetus]